MSLGKFLNQLVHAIRLLLKKREKENNKTINKICTVICKLELGDPKKGRGGDQRPGGRAYTVFEISSKVKATDSPHPFKNFKQRKKLTNYDNNCQ